MSVFFLFSRNLLVFFNVLQCQMSSCPQNMSFFINVLNKYQVFSCPQSMSSNVKLFHVLRLWPVGCGVRAPPVSLPARDKLPQRPPHHGPSDVWTTSSWPGLYGLVELWVPWSCWITTAATAPGAPVHVVTTPTCTTTAAASGWWWDRSQGF